MMNLRYLVPIIPVLWFSGLSALPADAQTVEALARAYRQKPAAGSRAALERYAAAHQSEVSGAQAQLALGMTLYEGKNYGAAIPALRAARQRLPRLADYIDFHLASACFGAQDYEGTLSELEPFWERTLASPLTPRALSLAVAAHIKRGTPNDAIALVQKRSSMVSAALADVLVARAHDAAQDAASAAVAYQRVYFQHPVAAEATEAGEALQRIKISLGDRYPQPTPQTLLQRAFKLLEAKQYWQARRELEAVLSRLSGEERELAEVRIGVADYFARDSGPAYQYLNRLRVSSPEAAAERLYYLNACARRLKHEDEALQLISQLDSSYPQSKWRMQALLETGNYYLLQNRPERYEPLFRACAESFPGEARAPYCHWKVAWAYWLRRDATAVSFMREHLQRFPQSDKASAALYYLARHEEGERDFGAARVYYQEIAAHYSNWYYAVLARQKLAEPALRKAVPSPSARQFLDGIEFPDTRVRQHEFEPVRETNARLERARLLRTAGLDDWAEGELKFGARNGSQSHIFAVELAQLAERRGNPDQAIRYIKAYAPSYLAMPIDSAPPQFWRLAFPIPYRTSLERWSRDRGLDPYLVAALIRQESEFNPGAVSPAKAYGLTQVLPSTGRLISRRAGIRRFAARMLLQPEVNIQIGTFYLKSLWDQLGNRWEATLAAYNGGPNRVAQWLNWGDFKEPPEFVETIPFTETREYVQAVLRNADLYRRLYNGKNGGVIASGARVER